MVQVGAAGELDSEEVGVRVVVTHLELHLHDLPRFGLSCGEDGDTNRRQEMVLSSAASHITAPRQKRAIAINWSTRGNPAEQPERDHKAKRAAHSKSSCASKATVGVLVACSEHARANGTRRLTSRLQTRRCHAGRVGKSIHSRVLCVDDEVETTSAWQHIAGCDLDSGVTRAENACCEVVRAAWPGVRVSTNLPVHTLGCSRFDLHGESRLFHLGARPSADASNANQGAGQRRQHHQHFISSQHDDVRTA